MTSHCCVVPAPDLLMGGLTQAELLFLMAASAAPPLSASHTRICYSNESFPSDHVQLSLCVSLILFLFFSAGCILAFFFLLDRVTDVMSW